MNSLSNISNIQTDSDKKHRKTQWNSDGQLYPLLNMFLLFFLPLFSFSLERCLILRQSGEILEPAAVGSAYRSFNL